MTRKYDATIYVMAPCIKDWVDETKVTFIDISEDIQGRDMLTYKCPICEQTHTSVRMGR